MAIRKIKVTNFKNFDNLEINLDNLNVVIGANASGKSNFVQIFQFIRDIAISGLENAISMQGGIEYLRNLNSNTSRSLSVKVDSVPDHKLGIMRQIDNRRVVGIEIHETTYEFALKLKKRALSGIGKDCLSIRCKFVELEEQHKPKGRRKFKEKGQIGQGEIRISCEEGRIETVLDVPEVLPIAKDDIFPMLVEELPPDTLLIESPIFYPIEELLSDTSVYDFDPRLPKKATPVTGKAELEEDGSNLSIILKNITEDRDKSRKLNNLVKDILPFVKNLDVDKFADKSLLFKLQEMYFENDYLPASLISDGTINITVLIVALYFEKEALTIVEEPERNIHPSLISKVVDMMKDAADNKQIIVTTHNPEIVKNAGMENILLISRDKGTGFSTISRPEDKESVRIFLENEIGLDELYVQNLLEV